MRIAWILNAQGIDKSISGSTIRFQAIATRWKCNKNIKQLLITTSGGADIMSNANVKLKTFIIPASIFIKKEPFKFFRMWSYIITSITSLFLYRKIPKSDYYITVSDYFCDIIPALLVRRRDINSRWIAWIHHKELSPRKRPGNPLFNTITWCIQEWSFKRIAKYADQAWVLNSSAGKQVEKRLKEMGMATNKIIKMNNGIDLSLIKNVKETEKKVDAIMIGARPSKGLYDIVPIWKEVQNLRPGTTLKIVGGITDKRKLLHLIDQNNLSRFIKIDKCTGNYVPIEQHISNIKECRVLFAPSHEEGWGIAICEAMACKLPVIAYDLPVYKDIFKDNIITIPQNNYLLFAKRICQILDNNEEYNHYSEYGYRCATNFDWDTVAANDLENLRLLTLS